MPHVFDMFFRKKDGQDYRIGRGLGLHFVGSWWRPMAAVSPQAIGLRVEPS